jgi:uncharacterized membrane protein (UPF0182 family)
MLKPMRGAAPLREVLWLICSQIAVGLVEPRHHGVECSFCHKILLESILQGQINYIRNSVKVLVDAHDGTLRFFAVDETDPVLATYRQIFPQLFEPRTAIPPEVKAHFRYPLDLFKIQAQMYLSYHMSDPEVLVLPELLC